MKPSAPADARSSATPGARGATTTLGPIITIHEPGNDHVYQARLARADDGGFLVAWTQSGEKGRFRRLDASGTPIGELRRLPLQPEDIAAAGAGFWVAGTSDTYSHVFLQRFDHAGGAVGPPEQVSDEIDGWTLNLQIAANKEDHFMVVWYQEWCGTLRHPCISYGGKGRGFDADGNPLSGVFDFDLNGVEVELAIAPAANGSFVISGSDYWYYGPSYGRQVQADGQTVGSLFNLDGTQILEALEDGSLAALWTPRGWENANSLHARRFDNTGKPLSEAVEVTGCTVEECFFSRAFDLAAGAADDFLVAWVADQGSEPLGVNARWFSPNMRAGEVVSVAKLLGDSEFAAHPAILHVKDGTFLIVWADANGVFGRFISVPLLFADGFESGDTGSWSTTAP